MRPQSGEAFRILKLLGIVMHQGPSTNVREIAQETNGEIFNQNPKQTTPTKAQSAMTVTRQANKRLVSYDKVLQEDCEGLWERKRVD